MKITEPNPWSSSGFRHSLFLPNRFEQVRTHQKLMWLLLTSHTDRFLTLDSYHDQPRPLPLPFDNNWRRQTIDETHRGRKRYARFFLLFLLFWCNVAATRPTLFDVTQRRRRADGTDCRRIRYARCIFFSFLFWRDTAALLYFDSKQRRPHVEGRDGGRKRYAFFFFFIRRTTPPLVRNNESYTILQLRARMSGGKQMMRD